MKAVLKEDYTLEIKGYGNVTIPKGTLTDLRTQAGKNTGYSFVCEFDWIDTYYPQTASQLRQHVDNYNIIVPKDILIPALRLRFAYDDMGSCRDIFIDKYSGQKYCRMEYNKTYSCWYTITPDWEEPDCPLRTDIWIQILGKDGKVAVTEQQQKENGEFFAEKKCLFSWEELQDDELGKCSVHIYRQEIIKYIIDSRKLFRGVVENEIREDGIVCYTENLNFEEYKLSVNNPDLIVIDKTELEDMICNYKWSRMKVFEEISEDDFYDKLESMPPKNTRSKNGVFSFFMGGGALELTLQNFYFQYKKKFYGAVRDLEDSGNYLDRQANAFLTYYLLPFEELTRLSEEYLDLHIDDGGASEFNSSINDISKATVHQFKVKYGNCFLGKLYLYGDQRKKLDVKLIPYEGQLIRKFEYDFVVPCNDPELVNLIRELNKIHKDINSQDVIDRIVKVTARIVKLKGVMLTWS